MMQFHETKTGKIFFESQLPELISALTDIAKALNTPKPVYQLKAEVPADFLANLYYGNHVPSGLPDTKEEMELTPEILACQRQLREGVSPDIWVLIERYNSLLSSRSVVQREQAFAAGFRSAMTMLAAGLMVPTADKEHRPG